MTPQARITQLMTERRWSMDRLAGEMRVSTQALKWWLMGNPPIGTMTWAALRQVEMAAERILGPSNEQKPMRTLADEQRATKQRMQSTETLQQTIRVLTARGLRATEIADLAGISRSHVRNILADMGRATGWDLEETLRLVSVTTDLVGTERTDQRKSVRHPLYEELAARMELHRLIEEANARREAA